MCGEFNSGVQIQSLSEEHEQVFTVKKISQYPHYNPKRVNIMITNILASWLREHDVRCQFSQSIKQMQ